ncbi:hypothetical protein CRYUN_Cryun10bG0166600 [Craigia yunnanensis]
MEPESVRFMAREIIILHRLDHPNVMKLEGLITCRMSGSLYLIFEYMEHDLAALVATPGVKFTEAQKQPLTSRVVTLWYRPPELLIASTDYGVAVDLWSSGCILAELFAGKPIMSGRTEDFPASALGLLEVLLAIEPECCGTASSAPQSEFFTTNPLTCYPSSLPKYQPNKEFDAKLREEESRRRRAAGEKVCGHDPVRKISRESTAVPAPDANAELQASIQKQQGQFNAKSGSKVYHPEEDGC